MVFPMYLEVAQGGFLGSMSMLLVPILLIAMMYFMMIRPQKKQEKKLAEQRKNMQVGDQVVSIGGIMGKVVNIREDEVTIASSVAGTMITFRKDAINQILTARKEAAAQEE